MALSSIVKKASSPGYLSLIKLMTFQTYVTTMALSSIVKKASSLLRFGGSDSLKPPPLDGEIIYCKNNVCVHPPASLLVDSEHHPGYLTLRAHQSEVCAVSLSEEY